MTTETLTQKAQTLASHRLVLEHLTPNTPIGFGVAPGRRVPTMSPTPNIRFPTYPVGALFKALTEIPQNALFRKHEKKFRRHLRRISDGKNYADNRKKVPPCNVSIAAVISARYPTHGVPNPAK